MFLKMKNHPPRNRRTRAASTEHPSSKEDAQLISKAQRFFRNAAAGLVRGQIVFRFCRSADKQPAPGSSSPRRIPANSILPFHFLICTQNRKSTAGTGHPSAEVAARPAAGSAPHCRYRTAEKRLVNILNVATPGHHHADAQSSEARLCMMVYMLTSSTSSISNAIMA